MFDLDNEIPIKGPKLLVPVVDLCALCDMCIGSVQKQKLRKQIYCSLEWQTGL